MAEAAVQEAEGTTEAPPAGAEGQVEDKGTEAPEPGKTLATNGKAAEEAVPEGPWHKDLDFGDKKIADFAARHTSPTDLAKTAFELRQKLGKAISLPGKNASEEEIAEYREKIGVPKDAKGYKLALPEDFPEELAPGSDELLSNFAAAMHEEGAPVAVAQKAAGFFAEWLAGTLKDRNDLLEQENESALKTLKKEWGKDFETNKTLALRVADPKSEAAKSLGLDDPSWKEFFDTAIVGDTTLGSHPKMLKLLATVGRRFLEADHREGMSADDIKSGEAKMDELTRGIHDARNKGDTGAMRRLNEERAALADKLYGTGKVQGAF